MTPPNRENPRLHAGRTRCKSLVFIPLLCALATCSGPADQLAEVAGRLGARLSVASDLQVCPDAVPPGGTILARRCHALDRRAWKRLSKVVRQRDEADPAALHTTALVDLLSADASGKALDRSISTLRRAAELSKRPAPVLADLAAALIVRAERDQTPRDLLEAYEAAEQALAHDRGNLGAMYNRALALDRFGLADEAARDWSFYLDADAKSTWADDARRRRTIALSLRPPHRPAADAPLSQYARYAATDPQGARQLGMDELLAEWGEAVEAGNATRAANLLQRADTLGQGLKRRAGGDASLADAVRTIHAAASSSVLTGVLARAHRQYGSAQQRFNDAEYDLAEIGFASAATADASPVLRDWAMVYVGGTKILTGSSDEGQQVLRKIVAVADSARYPSLVARARWALGSALNRAEKYEQALSEGIRSAQLLMRVGELENAAGALHVVADARFVLGEPDSGYVALHEAIMRVRHHRSSLRLHNLLVATARTAAADGFPRAAIRLQDEGVRVSARTGRAIHAAEARLARARLLAASGRDREAAADVSAVRTLLGSISNADQRTWLQADLQITEAFTTFASQPGKATPALDSAASYFMSRVPFRALPALIAGAEARLAMDDVDGAAQRLEAAVLVLEQRRDSIRLEPRRAAVFDAARSVVDRLVMLRLAAGNASGSLDYMDRGRASLAPVGAPVPTEHAGVHSPPGEIVVEYALVADTLLIWTVVGQSVEVFRTAIDTVRLIRTIAGLEARLERRIEPAEVRAALSALYEWLVRPIQPRLGPGGTLLVVIADGALAAVPFSALYDDRAEQYVVETHPLRFAASLREARRTPAGNPAEGVVLVADPAYVRRDYPLLNPLPYAREEVRRASQLYPRATLLEGQEATAPALKAALVGAGIVHFAGHAVFDDARPERSHLVLAPAPGPEGSGRMMAGELSRLDLRHVRLVVLSACRTVRLGHGRAAGFTGLSGALLAAGVGGTIGSTWDVEDRLSSVFMSEFHRAYRHQADGPRALRASQLALLRSLDVELQSPAAWAGFRYSGR